MKIFNKQRFNLIPSKHMKKYLLYAFGEIILVIIGILIALGINNWNQNQQLKHANTKLQNKVLVQLEKDILNVQNFQKNIDSLNQTYLKVLNRKYDSTKVDESALLSTILFDVNTISLDKHLNNLIENAKLDDSKASQELIEINSMYKLYLKDISDIEDIIYEKMTNNLLEIETTQPWYTELITDFVCRNDCINYLLHDEGHKARIASLRFLYINGYGYAIIEDFHKDLVASKIKLEKLIHN